MSKDAADVSILRAGERVGLIAYLGGPIWPVHLLMNGIPLACRMAHLSVMWARSGMEQRLTLEVETGPNKADDVQVTTLVLQMIDQVTLPRFACEAVIVDVDHAIEWGKARQPKVSPKRPKRAP